ncbi:hypothetical protein DNX69_11260 [Rhodopseudomonas palustris]|uniref:Uncharacterized protein n=1 Tax=Rhodopseudomonas palustris TaxID=1076 RepID=A0A323UVN3_RHOPL|nr:hypothetical protein [Rhodopseudomonas palustris]PZA11698.1 hypothetical protein DNX69_11260 [Rhodopseudomonas palustris]
MRSHRSQRRLTAPLALLLAAPVGLGAVFAVPLLHRTDPPLQRLADEAALASVNALAAAAPLTAQRRDAVSAAAAKRVLGHRPASVRASQVSADTMEVSVEVTDPTSQQRAQATARYLPPSLGRHDQKSASVGQHAGPPSHM